MQNIKNFKRYEPVGFGHDLLLRNGVLFFLSEDGQDWYECQKLFKEDTLKFAYDANGVIRSISHDISTIYPDGLSVAEVMNSTANRRADISGDWCFLNGSVARREKTDAEMQQEAQDRKNALLAASAEAILPLQDAVELGEATQQETANLLLWKKFRLSVSRVDTTQLPVSFPQMPK